jgi:hypothetical protein
MRLRRICAQLSATSFFKREEQERPRMDKNLMARKSFLFEDNSDRFFFASGQGS